MKHQLDGFVTGLLRRPKLPALLQRSYVLPSLVYTIAFGTVLLVALLNPHAFLTVRCLPLEEMDGARLWRGLQWQRSMTTWKEGGWRRKTLLSCCCFGCHFPEKTFLPRGAAHVIVSAIYAYTPYLSLSLAQSLSTSLALPYLLYSFFPSLSR